VRSSGWSWLPRPVGTDSGWRGGCELVARVVGVGVETADMLVQEVLSRNLRDRRAVARYAGVTDSPDESGAKRRERGLVKAGNARVRRDLMQSAASRRMQKHKVSAPVVPC
jgi:transposase